MAQRVQLYPRAPKLALETASPLSYVSDCQACALNQEPKVVDHAGRAWKAQRAIKGEAFSAGSGETLLVVGEGPGRDEAIEGRPFVGRSGAVLRSLLRKWWKGNIVLDNGTRCHPGVGNAKVELDEPHVNSCRGYLSATYFAQKPQRIVALGAWATFSVLGWHVNPMNSRRGYAWAWNDGQPIPVFYVLHPAAGLRNRFLMQFFEEDLEWALTCKLPPPKHLFPEYPAWLVQTPEDAREAVNDLLQGEGFAFDLEWAGYLWDPDFRLMTMAAAPVGRHGVWVWDERGLNDPALWDPIRDALADPAVAKGGSNVKADLHALWCGKKLRVRGISFDTRLRRKLLEPDATANLEDMAELVGMGGHKAEAEASLTAVVQRIQKWASKTKAAAKVGQGGFDFSDADAAMNLGFDFDKYADNPRAIAYAFLDKKLLTRYVARDSLTTARLESQFSYKLAQKPNQQAVWDKIVMPASVAIQRVEEWGVPYDRQAGQLFRTMMQQGMDAAYEKIQQYAAPGQPLNPGSPQQLAKVLFDKLKLKASHKTDTGALSTGEEAMFELRASSGHPLPGYILDYRHYQKLVGYAKDWDRCVRGDGRVHPSIHLDGARSGRTSCSDPNLQNLPRAKDSADGKAARDCFVAPFGHVFVQLDYSQLELRIAALLARDEAMAELFKSGVDFHLGTAKLISKLAWNMEPDAVTDVQRTGAKAFNFGIAYGKTDETLASDLGISVHAASQIRAAIFGKFVRYGVWCKEAIAYARQYGGSWTEWEGQKGRWRPLWRIADDSKENAHAASTARNGAINTPIQGTASEFCISSIVRLVDLVDAGQLDAEVVLPIHDSIMLVCPEATWKQTAKKARAVMTDFPWCTDFVPLEADVEMGRSWGSLKKVKAAELEA